MYRLMKFMLLMTPAVFGICLCIMYAILWVFNPASEIQSNFRKGTGLELEVRDGTSFTLLPTVGFTLRGVSIRHPEAADSKEIAEIGLVSADVSVLRSLFFGKAFIENLKIESATVNIHRLSKQHYNIDTKQVLEFRSELNDSPSSFNYLRLESVRLKDVSVLFKDNVSKRQARVRLDDLRVTDVDARIGSNGIALFPDAEFGKFIDVVSEKSLHVASRFEQSKCSEINELLSFLFSKQAALLCQRVAGDDEPLAVPVFSHSFSTLAAPALILAAVVLFYLVFSTIRTSRDLSRYETMFVAIFGLFYVMVAVLTLGLVDKIADMIVENDGILRRWMELSTIVFPSAAFILLGRSLPRMMKDFGYTTASSSWPTKLTGGAFVLGGSLALVCIVLYYSGQKEFFKYGAYIVYAYCSVVILFIIGLVWRFYRSGLERRAAAVEERKREPVRHPAIDWLEQEGSRY